MQLKVRRPGGHSNDAKAAAVSLMDIASATSFQVPAPVRTPARTPVRTPVQTTANKQVSDPSDLCHFAILGPTCSMLCIKRACTDDLLEPLKSQV